MNAEKQTSENNFDFVTFLACGDDVTFLYVGVGDRAFWKDPKCVFRWVTHASAFSGFLLSSLEFSVQQFAC